MSAKPSAADEVGNAANRINSLIHPEQTPTEKPTEDKGPEEETPLSDTESDEPKYKVKVNGEEIEIPVSELKKGYMMERDYRHKTGEVAAKRKELDSKIADISEKISDAEGLIDIDISALENDEGKALRESDPDKFLKKVEAIQKRAEKLKQLKEKKAKLDEENTRERISKERELLTQKIPDWLDENIREKEAQDIVATLSDLGFSEEEIGKMHDHRLLALARQAMKFGKLSKEDLKDKEIKKPPKSAKPGSSDKKQVKTKEDKLRDKLKSSHDMKDAAALIRARMK